MSNDKIVSLDELLKSPAKYNEVKCEFESQPSGVYADRSSYGNRPILVIILEGQLPCVAYARKISEVCRNPEAPELTQPSLLDRVYCGDNERLVVAAAFVDSAIRRCERINVSGIYRNGVLELEFLKVQRCGFLFEGYNFPSLNEQTPQTPFES